MKEFIEAKMKEVHGRAVEIEVTEMRTSDEEIFLNRASTKAALDGNIETFLKAVLQEMPLPPSPIAEEQEILKHGEMPEDMPPTSRSPT